MNNIEFRILRESLHLSQTELAELWNVNIRTLQSWEQGREKIPQKRIDELIKIDKSINLAAEHFERQLVKLRKQNGKPDIIVLLAYKADTYDGDFEHFKLHNCLLSRSRQRAASMDYPLRIVYFDKQAYFDWLKGKDTQAKRAEWASCQI